MTPKYLGATEQEKRTSPMAVVHTYLGAADRSNQGVTEAAAVSRGYARPAKRERALTPPPPPASNFPAHGKWPPPPRAATDLAEEAQQMDVRVVLQRQPHPGQNGGIHRRR